MMMEDWFDELGRWIKQKIRIWALASFYDLPAHERINEYVIMLSTSKRLQKITFPYREQTKYLEELQRNLSNPDVQRVLRMFLNGRGPSELGKDL